MRTGTTDGAVGLHESVDTARIASGLWSQTSCRGNLFEGDFLVKTRVDQCAPDGVMYFARGVGSASPWLPLYQARRVRATATIMALIDSAAATPATAIPPITMGVTEDLASS